MNEPMSLMRDRHVGIRDNVTKHLSIGKKRMRRVNWPLDG
jgi:hypothetical protein